MDLPLSAGQHVTIRNRRPGDRLQPLGCDYRKRLKDVLIDRKVPREERDLLPLLCIEEDIVWVPGVTIDETVRLRGATHAWVAEIEKDREP
jgi:tRNA(Ile)-lysidine synthase